MENIYSVTVNYTLLEQQRQSLMRAERLEPGFGLSQSYSQASEYEATKWHIGLSVVWPSPLGVLVGLGPRNRAISLWLFTYHFPYIHVSSA